MTSQLKRWRMLKKDGYTRRKRKKKYKKGKNKERIAQGQQIQ